jgi:serine/threonine protein kinase
MFADFLQKILKWELKDRATAQELLDHPWLSMPDDYNYKMSDLEYKKYKLKQSIESANEEFLNQEVRVKKKNSMPDNFVG